MPDLRTIDCEENASFFRKLNFIQEETNALKIRLGELVREITSKRDLFEAENLQNRLLRLDEFISTTRYYLYDFRKKFCEKDINSTGLESRKRLMQLQDAMGSVESWFTRLKKDLSEFAGRCTESEQDRQPG
jgi:hypothetical protein